MKIIMDLLILLYLRVGFGFGEWKGFRLIIGLGGFVREQLFWFV
jgi:hypothetical protein